MVLEHEKCWDLLTMPSSPATLPALFQMLPNLFELNTKLGSHSFDHPAAVFKATYIDVEVKCGEIPAFRVELPVAPLLRCGGCGGAMSTLWSAAVASGLSSPCFPPPFVPKMLRPRQLCWLLMAQLRSAAWKQNNRTHQSAYVHFKILHPSLTCSHATCHV